MTEGPAPRPPALSVVVPTLDEAARIEGLLTGLAAQLGPDDEVVVVDGGSRDATRRRCEPFVRTGRVRWLEAPRGRARQLNRGAAAAQGPWLLFLHADTTLSAGALAGARAAAGRPGVEWGYFPTRLDGEGAALRWIERGIDWRTRLFGAPSGDQGLLVRRDLFAALGGFPDVPFLEDLALADRLRRRRRPTRLPGTIATSPRRWLEGGIARTVVRMWALRLAYRLGASPARLARFYPPSP